MAGPIQALRSGHAHGMSDSRLAVPKVMTAEPDHYASQEPAAAQEPMRRGGSILLVLLVAGAIVAVAVALTTIGRAQAQPYILGLLALLAMVGLFNLFAFAAGIIRFADRSTDDPVVRRIADLAYDGIAVTDPSRPCGLFRIRPISRSRGRRTRMTFARWSASSSAILTCRKRCSGC